MGPAGRVLTAWVMALALVCGLCLYFVTPPDNSKRPDLSVAPIAIIGTSLSRHAFSPTRLSGPGLLGDGLGHSRIAVMNGSAEELERLLEIAIEDRVPFILLELRPFLFLLSYETSAASCPGLTCVGEGALSKIRQNFRSLVYAFLDRPNDTLAGRLDMGSQDTNMDRAYENSRPLSERYPVALRTDQPSAQLVGLAGQARAAGLEIVLFLPPRSPSATHALGPTQDRQIDDLAKTMAAELDLALFAPRDRVA